MRNGFNGIYRSVNIFPGLASFLKTVFTILLIAGLISGGAFLVYNYVNENQTTDTNTNIALVTRGEWLSDNSSIGAYVYNDNNESQFILLSDSDSNGSYFATVDKTYTKVIFVDLLPDTTTLGLNWSNVRTSTEELKIPTDDKTYYHQYANKWSNSAGLLFTQTLNVMQLGYVSNNKNVLPAVYYFDAFGVNEAGFVLMTNVGESKYTVEIPVGYTHIVFVEYQDESFLGTWEDITRRTGEMIIPVNHNIIYIAEQGIWQNKFE